MIKAKTNLGEFELNDGEINTDIEEIENIYHIANYLPIEVYEGHVDFVLSERMKQFFESFNILDSDFPLDKDVEY